MFNQQDPPFYLWFVLGIFWGILITLQLSEFNENENFCTNRTTATQFKPD